MRELMVGKVATLRNFYKDSELKFDSNGFLIGQSKSGPWTYYARIEVSSVKFNGNTLTINGSRNVAQWEGTEFKNITLSLPVSIAIELQPGFTEAAVAHVIEKIFLDRHSRLSDVTPSYWKELLTTDRLRRAAWEQEKAAGLKGVYTLDSSIQAPRLLSKSEGVQTSAEPFKDVEGTDLVMSFIVEPSGQVKQLEIEHPIGLGIDDPIAETVSKWKFEPARKEGRPVPLMMYAKFAYRPRNPGHIDPYHTQPCPGIQNVFAC